MPKTESVTSVVWVNGGPVVPTTSRATGPNPKDVVGSTKAALLLVSPIAIVHEADAMMDGAGKYDPYNWRAKPITMMGYLHAALRHILAVMEGEEHAHDSQAKHLGHARATLGIVLDAAAHGCLIDDRPTSDGGAALRRALEEVAEHEAFRKQRREQAKGLDGNLRFLAKKPRAKKVKRK